MGSIQYLVSSRKRTQLSEEKLEKVDEYREKFNEALSNDLNMPQALAVAWEVIKSNIPSEDKYDLLMSFDEILGLNLKSQIPMTKEEIPEDIKALAEKREQLRKEKKFDEADGVRKGIEEKGYTVEDTPTGTAIERGKGVGR